ncbi:MAG TPA: multiheme c-type cytochrome [Armatimonadota bacterium]|nr:multiheme c-type cytochrome [Armatimonadota bacterium]
MILRIMGADRYDAVGVGALDLQYAREYAQAAPGQIPLVRALPRDDALARLSVDLRVKRLRGRDIGVTSLPPPPEGTGREAYLDAAARALAEMRQRCDFLVLLSQLGLEGDLELARRCGSAGPHAIIGNMEAATLREPLHVGDTVLLPTGAGGTHVGIAEIVFPAWGRPRIEHVAVVPAKVEGPNRAADPAIEDTIARFYESEQDAFVARIDRRLLAAEMAEGAGDEQRCGSCHRHAVATWRETAHSRAVDTLIERKRLVPECLTCHSTRYAATGRFDHAARAGDVDCTGCHPVVSEKESACPEKAARTRGVASCASCHTPAHSPGFNYTSYLSRVNHAWKPAGIPR